MEENQFSRTALGTAFMRGYHTLYDKPPKIFNDSLSYHLLTEEERSFFARYWATRLQTVDPAGVALCHNETSALERMLQLWTGTPTVLSRAQYAEERLEKAIEVGACQYVILGAGMDTFAFRCRDKLETLRVFEVDHPATQTFKRNRITELGWDLPAQLNFVSLDFTKESLCDTLVRSSYDHELLGFFSWLGVTYYLSRDAVFATLQSVAKIAPKGSMVVFDY